MTKKFDMKWAAVTTFADISMPDAEEHHIKAQLVYKIDALMKARKLQADGAAELFGVKQPDISKMLRGDFRQFSVERLMRFLVNGAGRRNRRETSRQQEGRAIARGLSVASTGIWQPQLPAMRRPVSR